MSRADKADAVQCTQLSGCIGTKPVRFWFKLIQNQRYLLKHSSGAEELIEQLYYVFLRFNNRRVAATQLF